MSDPAALLIRASLLRRIRACRIDDEFVGWSHKVYAIHFDDGVTLAARVTLDLSTWKADERSMKILEHVKKVCPAIKIPSIYAVDVGASSPKREPLVLMEWVQGRSLDIWNHRIPEERRLRFLGDLADFLVGLWSVPSPSNPAATQTYSAWLECSIDRGLRRTLSGNARWGDPIDYLILRSMVPRYAKGLDHQQEWRVAHGDMNAKNFMVDGELRLAGVIDWDWMFSAPLPAVVQYPWFIADIPGWHNDGLEEGETFEKDRIFLEQAVRHWEVSNPFASQIADLLFNSSERQFFQSSFHFKSIYEEFVSRHCPRTEANLSAATQALETFLGTHESLRADLEVQRIQKYLLSFADGAEPDFAQ